MASGFVHQDCKINMHVTMTFHFSKAECETNILIFHDCSRILSQPPVDANGNISEIESVDEEE